MSKSKTAKPLLALGTTVTKYYGDRLWGTVQEQPGHNHSCYVVAVDPSCLHHRATILMHPSEIRTVTEVEIEHAERAVEFAVEDRERARERLTAVRRAHARASTEVTVARAQLSATRRHYNKTPGAAPSSTRVPAKTAR